jgi:hypothetical protein
LDVRLLAKRVRLTPTSPVKSDTGQHHNQNLKSDPLPQLQNPNYVLAQQQQPRAWIAHLALTIALALILIWVLPRTAAAIVIGAYWSRYMALRDAGEQVIIDGACSSARTLVLALSPHYQPSPPIQTTTPQTRALGASRC